MGLLTSRQLANELNVSTQAVNAWVKRGCPYTKVGIWRVFDIEKVKAWYEDYKKRTLEQAAIKRWETIRQSIKESRE